MLILFSKYFASSSNTIDPFDNPITLSEKNKLFKKSDNLNDVSILADILVMKAIDKDGNKIFTLEDKLALMHKVDSDVLSRIATAMVQAINPEQVKKN